MLKEKNLDFVTFIDVDSMGKFKFAFCVICSIYQRV